MKTLQFPQNSNDRENNFKVEGIKGEVKLFKDYKQVGDGIIWGMQRGTMIQSHYTREDVEHTAKMRKMKPIKNGEEVFIEGQVYKTRILGDYSDCVVFDLK